MDPNAIVDPSQDTTLVGGFLERVAMILEQRNSGQPRPPMPTAPPPLSALPASSSSSLSSLGPTPERPTPEPPTSSARKALVLPKREPVDSSEMAPPFGECPWTTTLPPWRPNSIFLSLDEPKHGARHSPDDYSAGQMMSTLNEDNRPYFYIQDQLIMETHVLCRF